MEAIVRIIKALIGSKNYYRLRELLIPSDENRLRAHRKFFYGSFIQPGDLVFDVGANYGNRVFPLLELGAIVVAVEPQPKCARFLRERFGKDIHVVELGLSDRPGKMTMHISNEDVLSTFSQSWLEAVKSSNRYERSEWAESRVVEMTTMDALISEHGVPVFVKIDVEGFERSVLSGLNTAVPSLSFEYTVPECTDDVVACVQRIHALDSSYQFNFVVGEDMRLMLTTWLGFEKMKALIQSEEFAKTAFGDVYAALPSSRFFVRS